MHQTLRQAGAFALLAATTLSAHAFDYPFSLHTETEGTQRTIVAENRGPAPVSAQLHMKRPVNVTSDQRWPFTAVVPPYARVRLATVDSADPYRGSTFSYQFTYELGDVRARPELRYGYRLPFPAGARYRISQAYGGHLSTHNNPASYYAVDIVMPKGTPVLAARSGTVIEVVQHWGDGGPSRYYLDKANSVRVLHEDGSMAEYVHLSRGSATVRPGDRVEAGQMLGRSGNSGYTSGPHLHFNVQVNRNGKAVSVPFEFAVDGQRFRPRANALIGGA